VVSVPLDSIPVGGRLRILYGELPVELIRGVDGVEARSLWCTHSGCEVKWKEDQQIYFCACHDGKFDSRGEVVAGPPPRPLGQIPITVTDSSILVGESA
jgi:Rieske Fe-S protein